MNLNDKHLSKLFKNSRSQQSLVKGYGIYHRHNRSLLETKTFFYALQPMDEIVLAETAKVFQKMTSYDKKTNDILPSVNYNV